MQTTDDRLSLSRADCEAIASYVWQHTRASPNGRGYKVWERMWRFINGEKTEPVMPLFENLRENDD